MDYLRIHRLSASNSRELISPLHSRDGGASMADFVGESDGLLDSSFACSAPTRCSAEVVTFRLSLERADKLRIADVS